LFFRNELDPRKTQRLQNAEGPKNTFPELVIEKRLKYSKRRPVHRSAGVDGLAVRLLPLQDYISRQVGEELHIIHFHRIVVLLKFLTKAEAFWIALSKQALRHLNLASS
jgi:hypothetical protein